MSKLRSLSTAFWSDTWVEDLTPLEKLLFIYLVTNEKTNMLGIYEASVKKISFETGLDIEDVSNALKAFERVNKVKYSEKHIILVNFMKHQNYNTNMKKSAIETYNNLPSSLKINGLSVSKDNPSEGFERLSKGYGMVRKVEVEYEVEVKTETEVEDESEIPDINEIKIDLDYDKSTYRDIKIHKDYYLKDLRLRNAISGVKKNKITNEEIPKRLNEFHEELESKGRTSETFNEYADYFLKWHRATVGKNFSSNNKKAFATNR